MIFRSPSAGGSGNSAKPSPLPPLGGDGVRAEVAAPVGSDVAKPRRRKPSPVTMASELFVAAHRSQAAGLGERLALQVGDPYAFISMLSKGWREMADPGYADGVRLVTPGAGALIGIRGVLMDATHAAVTRASQSTPVPRLLDLAERLLREEWSEIRWFGIWMAARGLETEPERSWQLLRRAAGEAGEWITVDTLAHAWASGILSDPKRWAELDALVTSRSRWERRLVGSTIATLPFHKGGRTARVAARGLGLVGKLIGDDEPDVQKALSWALRSLTLADAAAVDLFLCEETEKAAATSDGYRAWVLRDALEKAAPDTAARLRPILTGIRRRPNSPATSIAAAEAAGKLKRAPAAPKAQRRISAP